MFGKRGKMPGRQEEDTPSSDSDNSIEFLCEYQSKPDENVTLTKEEEERLLQKLNLPEIAVKSVTVRRVVGPSRSKAGTATCSVLSAGGELQEYRSLPADHVIPTRYMSNKKMSEKALTNPQAKDPEVDQSVSAVDLSVSASNSVSAGDTNAVSQKVPIVNRFSDVILLSSDSESADDAKGEISNERGSYIADEQEKLPTKSKPLDILLLSDLDESETDTEDINQKKALTDASVAISKSLDILSLSDFDSDINEKRSEETSSLVLKESRVEVGSTICQVTSSVHPLAVNQNEKSFPHVQHTRTEEWFSKTVFLSNFGLVPSDEYPSLLKSLEEASLQKRLKKNLRPRKTKIVKS